MKQYALEFSDMSGGKNSAFPPHAIDKKQVVDTLNALHEKEGISRAPGISGLSAAKLFSSKCTGHFRYLHDDGTETLIDVSDGKVYSINLSAATKTQIGTMSGTGECYAVNAAGKLWIVNGTSFVKVEDDLSVYQVQITAPSTGAAVAYAGGTLEDGVYGCYVSYARYDSSTGLYLYSLPESLGDVTLGSGNNTVRVTLTESSDPQVNRIVVFLTDAGGSVPYYYAEVTEPTGTTPNATIDVASDATRNSSILMSTVSSSNQVLPITPSGIYAYDDRIFVWDINEKTIYWSLKTDVNALDLERYISANFRTLAYPINSMFSVGTDLYFNHKGIGVSVAYNGDMGSIIKHIQKQFWYLDCKTTDGKSNIVEHKGIVFGLTNDGFRFFDGIQFGEDVSFHIKPDIDTIYTGLSKLPSAIVIRRAKKRTEYRFSYKNFNYGASENNDQRVFNLDFYFDPINPVKTWECWENGFTYSTTIGSVFYGLQNGSADAQVIKEHGVADINCYDRTGSYQTIKFIKQIYILTGTFIDQLNAISIWGPVCALFTGGGELTGNLILFDKDNEKYPFSITGISPNLAILPSAASGLGLPLPFIMNPQYPIRSSEPSSFEARSNSVALELSQIEDDVEFQLYKIQLPTISQEINNIS